MSTQTKEDILQLGETFVTLLKSPICPLPVRTSIIQYLDQVRKQLDMTNPELVSSVFNFLAATDQLPASESVTQAQGQAISSVLVAAAHTGELPNVVTVPATGELPQPAELKTMAAAAGPFVAVQPTQLVAQPVTLPVTVSAPLPDPGRNTGRNLASRLTEDRE